MGTAALVQWVRVRRLLQNPGATPDRSPSMKTTRALAELGQSLWLDNITRPLLDSGTLDRYIDELDVTGLTSNPTIYDRAIGGTDAYDAEIAEAAHAGRTGEDTFFEVALSDLRRAADLFRPVHDRTGGVDGFVSLEVSPLLAYDAEATVAQAKRLHAQGDRPNLFIKIPGTPEGLPAVEEAIAAGVPVNVTLLFSPAQYLACAEAYTRGIERRVEAGLPAYVASVASLFISRWDPATAKQLPDDMQNQVGLAIGRQSYAEYEAFFASDRWQRLLAAGARPQRLLFASTGTKDPALPPTLYITGLAAPDTVNTMPEETLLATGAAEEAVTGLDAEAPDQLARFTAAGLDIDAIAEQLQRKGAESFVGSWTSLLDRIAAKVATVA
jgi:transaldolase